MLTINRIGLGSAFKVCALISALGWAIIGIIYMVFFFALANNFGSLQVYNSAGNIQTINAGEFMGGTSAILVFVYACGVPVYAVFGGITGVIGAFIFNLAVRIGGGLQIEVSGMIDNPNNGTPLQKRSGKSVYIPDDDDPFSDATFRQ